ncbi:MAG: tetratricopeptide repeat protein [Caldilinea sp.]
MPLHFTGTASPSCTGSTIAAALGGLAGAEWAEGRRADALAHYREALQIARAIGYMPLTLHLLAQLGACCYEAGDHDQGRTLLALSLHHNASGQEVKDQVARLLDCHQITLTPSDVAAALEQVQPDVFSIFLADLTGRLETLAPI